jgi:hypothetical protein
VSVNLKVKYDVKKLVKQISNVEEYNSIGIQEGVIPQGTKHEYTTRKKEAQKTNNSQKVKINKKELVKKKKILIPETEQDKRYKEILESKRKLYE